MKEDDESNLTVIMCTCTVRRCCCWLFFFSFVCDVRDCEIFFYSRHTTKIVVYSTTTTSHIRLLFVFLFCSRCSHGPREFVSSSHAYR